MQTESGCQQSASRERVYESIKIACGYRVNTVPIGKYERERTRFRCAAEGYQPSLPLTRALIPMIARAAKPKKN